MGKGEDTRSMILDAALAQASEGGFESLTIGTLAARTGLSKSGLFAHFRSKEALQVETLDRAAERFIAAEEAADECLVDDHLEWRRWRVERGEVTALHEPEIHDVEIARRHGVGFLLGSIAITCCCHHEYLHPH